MKKVVIIVEGLTCNACVNKIENTLKKIKNIIDIKVHLNSGLIDIYYQQNKFDDDVIKSKIIDLGYIYKGVKKDKDNKNNKERFWDILPIFGGLIVIYLIVGVIFGYDFLNFLPTVDNSTPLIMLFLIGLMTSIHCIGMCGSINLAVSVSKDAKASIMGPILYNIGRIISYTLTGAIVGGIGSVLSFNHQIQGLIILTASILMFMMGLAMLRWLPNGLYKFLPKLPFKNKINYNKVNAPLTVGLLNGIMPCGPLQTMQLYALSTGSIVLGALSMFLFALGTVPLVLTFGLIFSKLKGKYNVIIKRISSVLIIMLSLLMFGRALSYLGISITNIFANIFIQENYDDYAIAELRDGYQYVEIELNFRGYTPILVQKNIPVVFNIKVENIEYFGCTNSIMIPALEIKQDLKNGDNLIKFTPTKIGDISYTCWMGMVNSNIRVVSDIAKYRK